MIAKLTIKSDSYDNFQKVIEDCKEEYQILCDNNPSTTYTLFVDEENLEVKVKILDIGVSIN